jgi:transposase
MPDSLWQRVVSSLKAVDPTPPPNARELLDAVFYHSLTAAPWEELPSEYPPHAEVMAAAERWQALGLFERLATVLHIQFLE